MGVLCPMRRADYDEEANRPRKTVVGSRREHKAVGWPTEERGGHFGATHALE
jgi:hypothetical protein